MSRGIAILISALIAFGALSACRESGTSTSRATHDIAPMPQAAYLWQRNWTPGVRQAVARPPAGIEGLRVLIAEVSAPSEIDGASTIPATTPSMSTLVTTRPATTPVMTTPLAVAPAVTMMNIHAPSLAASRLPITLVVRIEGSRPIESFELSPFTRAGDALRAVGVNVVGIEVDHDCATAGLAEYAQWLERQRGVLSSNASSNAASSNAAYRFSITALPTWAWSPSLVDVARSVDEIVVQVHAVRAPMIFDASDAWRDLSRFARALRTDEPHSPTLRVALPTYSAVVRDIEVSVDPDDVARFADKLRAATDPDLARVRGIVWFRLPVDGDGQTWSRATFARIVDGMIASDGIAGAHVGAKSTEDSTNTNPRSAATTNPRLAATPRASNPRLAATPRATIELVSHGDQRFDVVVTNRTNELVDLPRVRVAGDIDDADMVAGYRAAGAGTWDAPRRSLAREERIVIGWIHGKDITLVD
jgi:hypothetical protein